MDEHLINYIISGKAWLLVGAGPSVEMGYPTWEQLASIAIETVKIEQAGTDISKLSKAFTEQKYPVVFQEAKQILGGPRLLQVLRDNMKPKKQDLIYKQIAKWPIQVYMTTNYDDELQMSLTNLSLPYLTYSNSKDHLNMLLPDFSGAIVKLHGDLRSEAGLILTEEDYKAITKSNAWDYWRIKMAAVFQMNRIIVIGHSLTDRNIKHVLEAARKGSGVNQPVIWIAPDVPTAERKRYLEQYRIRILPYENKDGQHKNLVKLIDSINNFIPQRAIIRLWNESEKTSKTAKLHHAAAGFFVFNEIHRHADFENKRIDIILSAIQSALPELSKIGDFSLEEALTISGWPSNIKLDSGFATKIIDKAIANGTFQRANSMFRVDGKSLEIYKDKLRDFNHMRERFRQSLKLRILRDFPLINDAQALLISENIDTSLTEYFREAGLSLATILFSKDTQRTMPSSILSSIVTSTTNYDDLTMRQAFFKASVDAFVRPESADIDYLGRISQGFFAFHGLGVFGDVAEERLKIAKDTVWLVDSDTHIHALALGAPTNSIYKECLSRLKEIGLRIFTTSSLLEEAREHLWFANRVVEENGQNSTDIINAAKGDVPYRKSNLFLEGFIKWRDAGNPSNWGSYLYEIFGSNDYSKIDIKQALNSLGIEVIDLSSWPGFNELDYVDIEDYTKKIAIVWDNTQEPRLTMDSDLPFDAYKKAKPEAEAFNIVKRERDGDYYINSEKGHKNNSWFISYTSILNMIDPSNHITWPPQAFLSFASTLCNATDAELANQSFNRLVLGLAQSGLNLLDNDTIARVFGSVIDQAKLNIEQLRQEYQETLQSKYGEPIESVLARVNPAQYPLAAMQLANEVAITEGERRRIAEKQANEATQRVDELQKELRKVEKYRTKLIRKKSTPKKPHKKKNG